MTPERATCTDRGHKSVAIVGAGIAGLISAREFRRAEEEKHCSWDVVVLEKESYFGGRIKPDFLEGHVLDTGAEIIHGKGTLLTELIDELLPHEELEDHFITSHADGGPSPQPTGKGHYGVYFVDNELHHFEDRRLWPLHRALASFDDDESPVDIQANTSIEDALSRHKLSEGLRKLAVASYGNTVGCTDHSQISLSMLMKFEKWWQENEEEGDMRIVGSGLFALIEKVVDELRKKENISLLLNTTVDQVQERSDGLVRVSYTDAKGKRIERLFDAAIVTVPPPLLPSLIQEMSPRKLQSLKFFGMEPAVKVFVVFREQVWPENITSVISGEHLVPEIWFHQVASQSLHLAVGFMTSSIARRFAETVGLKKSESGEQHCKEAKNLIVDQLSEIFSIPLSKIRSAAVKAMVFWHDYSYMYPRVGMTIKHLEDLAAPQGNIHFAGEATHTGACCTVQAAISTGRRAATEVLTEEFSS